MNIPIAHVEGGDRVTGNVDDYVRHAVTKLAHVHFASTENNKKRIIRMGEEPWRVHNAGNLGLDKYRIIRDMPIGRLKEILNFDIAKRPLLVVIHNPLSTESEKAGWQTKVIMKAIDRLKLQTIVIHPNSDAGCLEIMKEINAYAPRKFIKIFKNLPKEIFVNLMRHCDCLVGNSSCGILEAPLLKVPAVNIGMRQEGREHAGNVIFTDYGEKEIERAIKKALYDKKFRKSLKKCKNPYGDSRAAERIVRVLSGIKLDKKLLQKRITY